MNPLVTIPAVTFLALLSKRHLLPRRSARTAGSEIESKKNEPLPVSEPVWQWPIYDQFEDKRGRLELKKRISDNNNKKDSDGGPFRVIYRGKAHQLWPDVVQITLSSRPLIKIIQQYLPNDGDLKSVAEPTIDGRELYIVLDALKNREQGRHGDSDGRIENQALLNHELTNGDILTHKLARGDGLPKDQELTSGDIKNHKMGRGGGVSKDHQLTNGVTSTDESEAGKDMEQGKLDLMHLVRFMEKEYQDIPVRMQRMRGEKRVAWDMLWVFLPRGSKVVYHCDHSKELLCAVVSANYYHNTPTGFMLLLELDIWEYDGRTYHKCQIRRQIPKYDGERPFASVAVCPIEIIGEPKTLEKGFLANGRKYYELAVKNSHRFMYYTGPMFQQRLNGDCWQLYKENADGRVMIDLANFAKMNPLYPMGNARLSTASKFWISTVRGFMGVQFATSCASQESCSNDIDVSDESLIFAPAIVYGFSFTLKQWGSFAINGFTEISFDMNAFEELVMEPEVKGLVYNLVSQYVATPAGDGSLQVDRVDPISNKGEGCIFLCYGPPGAGKTLTAESIAEKMRRPLWALSVSELGTTPSELEKTLFKVLDIAATWRAVLLLDEADVYLEKRIAGADVTRNAMTGVFLRTLEYYRGVLFLTTNRIGTFDNAFRSRISMFLCYRKLSAQHKEQVWVNLLKRARVKDVTADFVSAVAAQDLNGREIRNAIHTSQIWAKSNGEATSSQHVRYVINIVASSLESLNDVIDDPEQS